MRHDLGSFVKHRSDEENCWRRGFAYSKYVVCICSRIKCTLVSAMHVILLLPRVFRVRSRPIKLHRRGRKTIPLSACFADINFALFVMNMQRLISNNQLSNAFRDQLSAFIKLMLACSRRKLYLTLNLNGIYITYSS